MAKRKATNTGSYKRQTTPKLRAFEADLYNKDKRMVFAVGLPSTGKTVSAIESGLDQLCNGAYEKIVVVRPVLIPSYGFLPGDNYDKMFPYIRQIGIYTSHCTQFTLEELMSRGQLEIIAVDQLQGNRFQGCFVVADEMQNVHWTETFKILSRVGEESKFVIIGDVSRGQQNKKIKLGDSLLDYCIEKFSDDEAVGIHTFYEDSDILGDDFSKHLILKLMDDFL